MSNKSRKPFVKGILKTGVMIEITDPAEKAALERRCQEAEKLMANRREPTRKQRPRRSS